MRKEKADAQGSKVENEVGSQDTDERDTVGREENR